MTKYETDFTTGAYDLPTPSEVAAAERAYARETRRLGASIAAWEGENAESEWMYLDADMCERHADIVEDPSRTDSYEAYMHIVEEYQAMLDEGAPASGIILYLPHKYIEQLNERRRKMASKAQDENQLALDELESYEEYLDSIGYVIEGSIKNQLSAAELERERERLDNMYKCQGVHPRDRKQLDEDTMLENVERDEIEAV